MPLLLQQTGELPLPGRDSVVCSLLREAGLFVWDWRKTACLQDSGFLVLGLMSLERLGSLWDTRDP